MTEEKRQFNNKIPADLKDRIDGHLAENDAKYEKVHLSANSLTQYSIQFALDYFDEHGSYPWEDGK